MPIAAAILLLPVGVALAVLLVELAGAVFGLAFLTTPALPFPLSQAAQWALGLGFAPTLLSLLIVAAAHVAITFLLYWTASAGLPAAAGAGLVAAGPAERFGRGGLVGLSAGMNLVFLLSFLPPLPGGTLTAWTLSTVVLFASSPAVSNTTGYQVLLAYATLFLPMSLPMNAVGFLVGTVNAAAALAGTPLTLFVAWTRAGLVMHGGVVHGCSPTAFNLANHSVAHPFMAMDAPWVNPGTPVWPFCPAGFSTAGVQRTSVRGALVHETGHTLNVGAFGWVYHLIGFADQWLPMPWSPGAPAGVNAHAELSAESGLRGSGSRWLDTWTGPAGPGVGNVPAAAVVTAAAGPGVLVLSGAPLRIACERGRAVSLDSTASADADGFPRPLGRLWVMPTRPPASTATVPTPNAATLVFVPDTGGLFQIDFHVTDGDTGGPGAVPGPFPVTLDVLGADLQAPPQPVEVGTGVSLDGTRSAFPPAGPAGTFAWTILVRPPGSALSGAALAGIGDTFTFVPDVAGDYEVELVVAQSVTPAAGGAPVPLVDRARVLITAA